MKNRTPVSYLHPSFESLQNCFVNIVHQFPGRELSLLTASLSSSERASQNQLPHSSQLQDPDVFLLCWLYANLLHES